MPESSGVPSRSLREWLVLLPQPLKGLWLLGLVAMAGGGLAFALTGNGLAVLPALAVLACAGAVLALDVRGNATRMTGLLRSGTWLGQDHSSTPVARPWFPRLVGAGVVVFAVVIALAPVIDPSPPGR